MARATSSQGSFSHTAPESPTSTTAVVQTSLLVWAASALSSWLPSRLPSERS